MKVSDQSKHIENQFVISNHAFINQIASGLQKRLKQEIPGLTLSLGGKSESGNVIKLVLSGATVVEGELEEAENKVRMTMDKLKNPSELLAIIE